MEILTLNAEQIRSADALVSDSLMKRYKHQWCSHKVNADDIEEETTLGHATYWAALYMRESNPTLFKIRANNWSADMKWQLEKMFARIEVMIHSGRITGDVVLYRSQSRRLTKSKYPLCNNGVYAIFTGNPEWILGDGSGWRSHTGELDPDYEQFRNNFAVYDQIYGFDLTETARRVGLASGGRNVINRVRSAQAEQEHLNMRVAYIWCMLTNERPFYWDAILDDCNVPQRAGLLLWKEGKNRLCWHHSNEVLEPQHIIATGNVMMSTSFENSGLDIDNSGRFIEAND